MCYLVLLIVIGAVRTYVRTYPIVARARGCAITIVSATMLVVVAFASLHSAMSGAIRGGQYHNGIRVVTSPIQVYYGGGPHSRNIFSRKGSNAVQSL